MHLIEVQYWSRLEFPGWIVAKPEFCGLAGFSIWRVIQHRAENSHQPTRIRERPMMCFKSSKRAQRFLSVFESINALFRLRWHLSATRYRLLLNPSFRLWNKNILAVFFS